MKKLEFEVIDGFNKERKLTDFINKNKIKQEDILKIVYNSIGGGFILFFITEKKKFSLLNLLHFILNLLLN